MVLGASPERGWHALLTRQALQHVATLGLSTSPACSNLTAAPYRALQMGRLRKGSIGMPKAKKTKVEVPQPTGADQWAPEASSPPSPTPKPPPNPSKPPPCPPSPAKLRVQAMKIPVTENWSGFLQVEKKVKAAEQHFKTEMRIFDAKERNLKQRRPTKSRTALDRRDADEMELIYLRAFAERRVLQWRLLSCESLLGTCHHYLEWQAAEIKRLQRKCNGNMHRVRAAN